MIFVFAEEPYHDNTTIHIAAATLEDAQMVAEGHLTEHEVAHVTPWIEGEDTAMGRREWWLGGANDLFIYELPVVGG